MEDMEAAMSNNAKIGKHWTVWMGLLDKMKAEPHKPLKLYFNTSKAAIVMRDRWYRIRKAIKGNAELYELYKDVLESRVLTVDGVMVVFEYKEPLGIEDAIKSALKEGTK